MTEELYDMKQHIFNYESLDEEEKIAALEKIYRIQLNCKEVNRTLEEIIEKQIISKKEEEEKNV